MQSSEEDSEISDHEMSDQSDANLSDVEDHLLAADSSSDSSVFEDPLVATDSSSNPPDGEEPQLASDHMVVLEDIQFTPPDAEDSETYIDDINLSGLIDSLIEQEPDCEWGMNTYIPTVSDEPDVPEVHDGEIVLDGGTYTAQILQIVDTSEQTMDTLTPDTTFNLLTTGMSTTDDPVLETHSGETELDGGTNTTQRVDSSLQTMATLTPDTTINLLTTGMPTTDDPVLETHSGETVLDGGTNTTQIGDSSLQTMATLTSDTTINLLTTGVPTTDDQVLETHGGEIVLDGGTNTTQIADTSQQSKGKGHQVGIWPWVRFFTKSKKNAWTLNETPHSVMATDIQTRTGAPDNMMRGSRLLYKFAGHDMTSRLTRSGSPGRPSKLNARPKQCVECLEIHGALSTIKTLIFSLRDATYGKRMAPFSGGSYPSAGRYNRRILGPSRQGTQYT